MFSYDPNLVTVNFGGIVVDGYADGSFVEIAYNSDLWSMLSGAGGSAMFAKTNDLTALITVRLMPNAFTNQLLSARLAADMTPGNIGVGDIEIIDGSTGTIHAGGPARIMKPPAKVYSKQIEAVEWVIGCLKLVPNYGAGVLGIIA